MVDEALVAGNIANTNGLLVILAKLVAKGVFDAEDLHAFSDSYSKPLDHENMRENELISQMQDQMEATLAQLMHFLADKGGRLTSWAVGQEPESAEAGSGFLPMAPILP